MVERWNKVKFSTNTFGGLLCAGHYNRYMIYFVSHQPPSLRPPPNEDAEAQGVRKWTLAHAGARWSTAVLAQSPRAQSSVFFGLKVNEGTVC